MIATDTMRLAIARHRQVSGGQTVMLIPAHPLSVLTGIVGDAKVEAGAVRNTLVFKGLDFVFTTRTMMGVFIDVNEILKTVEPQYDALVPAGDLWCGIDRLATVADDRITPMCLALNEDGAHLSYEGENSASRCSVEAVVYRPTPKAGFCYAIHGFSQAVRHMTGNIQVLIDRSGMMLIKNDMQCYLFPSVRPRKAVAKKQDTTKQAKKKKNQKNKPAIAA
jgi:hypothetical protein